MGGNSLNGFPVTDEITNNSFCSLRYSTTGIPAPTGSRVGIGVEVGKVGCSDGEIGSDVGVAVAQAVRITVRQRPIIDLHRRFCIGIRPLLKSTPPAKRKFP